MTKIDDFKLFVKNNPHLISYVKKGEKTWQDFYELYDLYGNDVSIWKEYLNSDRSSKSAISNINNILDTISSVDTEKLQSSITSVQKAISLFGDILAKNNNGASYNPRPVYRRFDD